MPGRKGQPFLFFSPFDSTPGWEDGDQGVLIRLLKPPAVDFEINDLWVARNTTTGQTAQLWGMEAWRKAGNGRLVPAIPEHRALTWRADPKNPRRKDPERHRYRGCPGCGGDPSPRSKRCRNCRNQAAP